MSYCAISVEFEPIRRAIICGALLVGVATTAVVAEEKSSRASFAREVIFDLTFKNRDLVWLGDPASPTALVYVKPGATPIATDAHVKTLVERKDSPGRQYLREARIDASQSPHTVYAFTKEKEQVIGSISHLGRFNANDFYRNGRELLPSWPADTSLLIYDPHENALYCEVDIPGPVVTESLDFLPWELTDAQGARAGGEFAIAFEPASNSDGSAKVTLAVNSGKQAIALATAALPRVFLRENVRLGSFDNKLGTYLPEAAYRPGADPQQATVAAVTLRIAGEFSTAVKPDGKSLVVAGSRPIEENVTLPPAKIVIDGNFDDWRNVAGVDDPRGDVVPYLEYVPDVDLLEFKVSNDDENIYLYARVAGQVGRSISDRGCSYFYAYMDVDQNAGTGFLPTRDDDCYFGVEIGDDCEVQFEFVDSVFRKTFYGFCGIGGDANVLKQEVTLGKSQYGRIDENGQERANYKSEYVLRGGATEITEDFKLGTSDTIRLAVSPDGREVEVVSSLAGFLKNLEGRPTLAVGQTIDVAVGMECDGKRFQGKQRWAADSTRPIRGYQLRPARQ